MSTGKRWAIVVAYAAAMAWVESAVVFYLRTMIHRIEPHQPNPLPIIGNLGHVELAREAATMIMLLTVGVLAGRSWRSRLGYTALAFGVWDIFYYVFLKMMCGWPHSILDWDILFLLPLPWWGPVLAPVSIAVLMILWGTLASQFDERGLGASSLRSWALNFAGVALALYVFMADSLKVADQGTSVLRNVLPERFNWPWFSVAVCLMAAPVASGLRRLNQQTGRETSGLAWQPLTLATLTRRLSLTPCFSWVSKRRETKNRFNGLPQAVETVETVPARSEPRFTQLKQGLNKRDFTIQ